MAWITLEEAAANYGIHKSTILSWIAKGNIVGTDIGTHWIVNNDTLTDYLKEELSTCIDDLFIFNTLRSCPALFELLLNKELSNLIPKEANRTTFYDMSTRGSIAEVAREHHTSYPAICKSYLRIIRRLENEQSIADRYHHTLLSLSIRCRNYETILKETRSKQTGQHPEQQIFPTITPEAALLLSTPVSELFHEPRIVRALNNGGIHKLEDLLRLPKEYGWNVIRKFHGLGSISRKILISQLQDKHIIDNDLNSYLYSCIIC